MPKTDHKSLEIKSNLKPTFLAYFSMDSYYQEDPNEISDQMKDIQDNKPETIYTFLADIQHYQTELVNELLNTDITEEDFNNNKEKLEINNIKSCYESGKKWIDQFGEYVGYEVVAESKESDSDIRYKPGKTSEDINVEDEPQLGNLIFSKWSSFDKNTINRLFDKKDNSTTHSSQDTDAELKSVCDSQSESSDHHEAESGPDFLKHLLFESIYLNSMQYYLNGLINIYDDFLSSQLKKITTKAKKKSNNNLSLNNMEDENSNYETYKLDIEANIAKIKIELKTIEKKLEDHNERLEQKSVPNVYQNIAYNVGKVQKNFSKQFASSILRDISLYINRNYAEKYGLDSNSNQHSLLYNFNWKIQTALLYSAKHQCQNLASIGIYSLVHGITYFTYPRQLGNSPLFFSKQVLGRLINNLYQCKNIDLSYKKLLTYAYHDEEQYYNRNQVEHVFSEDKDQDDKAFLKGTTKELVIKSPKPAEQKVIKPRSSISHEVISEMKNATLCAYRLYTNFINGNNSAVRNTVWNLWRKFPEDMLNGQDLITVLFEWSMLEANEIEEKFAKNPKKETKDDLKNAIIIVIFIITLCYKLIKNNEAFELEIEGDMLKRQRIAEAFARFLSAVDANTKDVLEEVARDRFKITLDLASNSQDAIDTLSRTSLNKSDSIEEAFMNTIQLVHSCLVSVNEDKLSQITPKKPSSPGSPGKKDPEVDSGVNLFDASPKKQDDHSIKGSNINYN